MDSRSKFKRRILKLYDVIYTCCQKASVTCPSFIAMGLGMFLDGLWSDDDDDDGKMKEDVMRVYQEAQFELLSSKDYGFHTVFLNPGKAWAVALKLLAENHYPFPCNIQLHKKDGKFLACELARSGKKTCCLIPSDCRSLLMGRAGGNWESGTVEDYTAEQDILATSTAI